MVKDQRKEGGKERNMLFNDALNNFFKVSIT